jgi:hypothetical protein
MGRVVKKRGVGEPPTIVRCCKGVEDGDSEVHGSLQTTLDSVLRDLTADPSIDVGATTTLLFCTAMDLGLRLQPFGEWPSKGCLLVQEYNPDGFLVAIMDFLKEDPRNLDVGCGLVLREQVRRRAATETGQILYMSSPPVQGALAKAYSIVGVESLEDERKHALVKKDEAARLSHVAVAGRNQILRAEANERDAQSAKLVKAGKEYKKAKKLRTNSLALHMRPDLRIGTAFDDPWDDRGRGVNARARKCGRFVAQPPHALPPQAQPPQALHPQAQPPQAQPPQAHMQRLQALGIDATLAGLPDALAAYHEDHKTALDVILQAKRVEARAKLDALSAPRPVDHAQWLSWMGECQNATRFRELMASETAARKETNIRLTALPGLAEPVERLQPQALRWRPRANTWAQLLWKRSGWYAARTTGATLMLFLYTWHQQTYCADCTKYRPRGGHHFVFSVGFSPWRQLKHLRALWEELGDAPGALVYELLVAGRGCDGGAAIAVTSRLPVTAPLVANRRAKGATGAGGSSESGEGGDSSDRSADSGSDLSSCPSVDTHVESAVGSDRSGEPSSEDSDVGKEPVKRAAKAKAPPKAPGGPPQPQAPPQPPAPPEPPAPDEPPDAVPPAAPVERAPKNTLWQNCYWFITAVPGCTDMRIRMKGGWKLPFLMGNFDMSKNTTLGYVGGDLEMGCIVLKAWGVWRARRLGFSKGLPWRERQELVDLADIEAGVRGYGAPLHPPLLGNAEAHALLLARVPDLVASLLCA